MMLLSMACLRVNGLILIIIHVLACEKNSFGVIFQRHTGLQMGKRKYIFMLLPINLPLSSAFVLCLLA